MTLFEQLSFPHVASTKAVPFIKWVGGKRRLMTQLLPLLPTMYRTYYEPFIGGGAMFFELTPPAAVLSDTNPDLIITYQTIKSSIQPLVNLLEEHAANHNKEYYYAVRSQHELSDPIERAARFIYLNRTCYNGLWRVNRKGHFNVPMGSYKNPAIVQTENLFACHQALQDVEIRHCTFDQIEPHKEDFVYFDPPYHPLDDSSFTQYSKQNFSSDDQIALRDLCVHLHHQGTKWMLSNSDTPFVREIYTHPDFRIVQVQAPRMVNSNPHGRGNVNEVVVMNYEECCDG